MKGPLKLADLRTGRSDFENDELKKQIEKEYNFGEYKQNVIEKSIKTYGDIYSAVFEMDAKISSLKLEADTLRELVDWEKVDECEEEE
tara:strand:- start:496 stop:759 length:264 start_codon:yes stop_codon:yes gene_type:complete